MDALIILNIFGIVFMFLGLFILFNALTTTIESKTSPSTKLRDLPKGTVVKDSRGKVVYTKF